MNKNIQERTIYKAYATCPNELTSLLSRELADFGAKDIYIGYAVVYFTADIKTFYRIHFQTRLSSRICRIIKEIPAQRPEIIFDKTRKIKFHQLFSPELAIRINTASVNASQSIANHLVGSKVREAINDHFIHHLNQVPNQSSVNAQLGINAYLNKKRLTISLDTSGESLHRRGYRLEGHPAPLKESLASALLQFCDYDGSVPFYDPMCGSGTIAIEAAYIATKKAARIYRKNQDFGLSYLKDFDKILFKSLRKELKAEECETKAPIFASDLNADFVEQAVKSAESVDLENTISFFQQDFFSSEKPADSGLLISNIPYGMRLDEKDSVAEYIENMGRHLKQYYKNWRCGILLPTDCDSSALDVKIERKMKIKNAKIPCTFLVFDIY